VPCRCTCERPAAPLLEWSCRHALQGHLLSFFFHSRCNVLPQLSIPNPPSPCIQTLLSHRHTTLAPLVTSFVTAFHSSTKRFQLFFSRFHSGVHGALNALAWTPNVPPEVDNVPLEAVTSFPTPLAAIRYFRRPVWCRYHMVSGNCEGALTSHPRGPFLRASAGSTSCCWKGGSGEFD